MLWPVQWAVISEADVCRPLSPVVLESAQNLGCIHGVRVQNMSKMTKQMFKTPELVSRVVCYSLHALDHLSFV